MEEKIEVNEYIRTKNGVIDKVDALYGMIENTVHLENQKWFDIKNIVKHSKQLIDLIEVGDIVEIRTGLYSSFKYFVENEDNLLLLEDWKKETIKAVLFILLTFVIGTFTILLTDNSIILIVSGMLIEKIDRIFDKWLDENWREK